VSELDVQSASQQSCGHEDVVSEAAQVASPQTAGGVEHTPPEHVCPEPHEVETPSQHVA